MGRWHSIVILVAAGCAAELPLEGRPCPCDEGWVCCEAERVCRRELAVCTALALTPKAPRLRLGGSLSFAATVPVTWSVVEEGGGSIGSDGAYRAPLRPGIYRVRATAITGESVSVPVRVGPTELVALLGTHGGPGTADGVGRDARFRYPVSLADGGDHLYVSDGPQPAEPQSFLRDGPMGVRRVSVATGEVSWLVRDTFIKHLAWHDGTLVGGSAGQSWPDSSYTPDGEWYYADPPIRELVRIDPVTGTLTLLAGKWSSELQDARDGIGAEARFANIAGMAADGTGSIYISDGGPWVAWGYAALRRVDLSTGEVTTIASNSAWPGPSGMTMPFVQLGAVAVHDGFVHVVDHTGPQGPASSPSHVIWKYDPSTGTFVELPMSGPYWAADEGDLGSWPRWQGTRALCFDPQGLSYGIVGNCIAPVLAYPPYGYVGCTFGDINGWAGSFEVTGPAGSFSQPGAIACAGDASTSTFFVTDSLDATIERLTLAKTADGGFGRQLETFAGYTAHGGPDDHVGGDMKLDRPTAIAADAGGNLVFNHQGSGGLVQLGASGSVTAHGTVFANDGGFLPQRIALGAGAIYFSGNSGIARFDLDSGTTEPVLEPDWAGPGWWWLVDLAFDGEATIFASHAVNKGGAAECTIIAVDANRASYEPVVEGACGALALDGAGQLFFGRGELWIPSNYGPAGNVNLYPLESEELFRIDLTTKKIRQLPTPPDGWAATKLAYDPAGVLYVAEASRRRVRALVVDTGEIFDVIGELDQQGVKLGPLPAGVNHLLDMTLLPGGELAMVDFQENVVLLAR